MRRVVSLLLGRKSSWRLVVVRLLRPPDAGVGGASVVTLRCSLTVTVVFFPTTDDEPASGYQAGGAFDPWSRLDTGPEASVVRG